LQKTSDRLFFAMIEIAVCGFGVENFKRRIILNYRLFKKLMNGRTEELKSEGQPQ